MRHNETRRTFFRRAGQVALGVAALRAFPLRAQEGSEVHKDASLILRSPNPYDVETPPQLLDEWITPNERFFSRSHLYTPRVDAATWRLKIDGAVEHPLTLSMNDIRQLERVNAVITLECAGNGRGGSAVGARRGGKRALDRRPPG
jgi:DMSO/TMAO reductase YedYZ molybdopterin-dependent catalytic subunit